jgi:hypothetical protein
VRLAARQSPHAVSDVPRGAGVPDPRPLRRGRHGVVSVSIELEIAPALGTRRCEPILISGSQKAIEPAMGRVPVEILL